MLEVYCMVDLLPFLGNSFHYRKKTLKGKRALAVKNIEMLYLYSIG